MGDSVTGQTVVDPNACVCVYVVCTACMCVYRRISVRVEEMCVLCCTALDTRSLSLSPPHTHSLTHSLPQGYLTDLKSMTLKSDADIADIKKARLLLRSVIQTNPNHAPGWVAIARLEELAGNMGEARKLLQEVRIYVCMHTVLKACVCMPVCLCMCHAHVHTTGGLVGRRSRAWGSWLGNMGEARKLLQEACVCVYG